MATGLEKDTFIAVAKEGHYKLSTAKRGGVAVCRVGYRVP
jgi:hypothetical protein